MLQGLLLCLYWHWPGPGPDCLVPGPDHSQSQVDPINDCTGVHKPWLYRNEDQTISDKVIYFFILLLMK